MAQISPIGVELIKSFESFQPRIYRCPGGYQTIGYGHVVRPHEQLDSEISVKDAEALLMRDIAIAESGVKHLILVPLTTAQYDALVSFAFNLGCGALQRSTLRRKVNREDHAQVPREFMKWVTSGGRKLRGLITRRQAEAQLYASMDCDHRLL